MIRSIQHVGLTLPDPAQAAAFYQAFGLEVGERDGGVVARCAGRAQDQVIVRCGPRRGLAYLSFGGRADELAATRTRLEQRGIRLEDPPHDGAPAGLWFRDLDRNLIHLGSEPVAPPRAARPVALNAHGGYVRLGERGALPFGTEPRPVRLGHVILFSPEPARQAAFYQDALGMKLSDRVGDDMVMFLRGASDGDHHLLGLLRESHPGLHHQSFELESIDHIALGARRLRDAGYAHVWGTGRHTVGSNLFHYFRDPWGTLAEYFHDIDYIPEGSAWEPGTWSKEQGLFLWSNDGPPPPDFPRNLIGAG
ncbi:MAG TPA: VOC family protein [Kofleriaceae bacterium]|jgi:catechol 2,3-dioxygenase-like lactoylglutathione lyase family enzyme|nr:VOC family protein [Kofleriaceae bacterium]